MTQVETSSAVPTLEYQTELREERRPDGTLCVSVTSERGGAMKMALLLGGMGLLLSCGLAALWMITGSQKAGIFAMTMGPPSVLFPLVIIASQLNAPKHQTHSVEVSAVGITIRSFIAGDPIVRNHSLQDLVSVHSNGMGLEIHTVKDQYSCFLFVKSKNVETVAGIVNRELAERGWIVMPRAS